MSGFGERFRQAGYVAPKPLIELEGKPIIAHVVDLFPGEKDFVFICNQEHLDNPGYRMRETLERYCPGGRIVGIPPHKLGPVYAISKVFDLIDPARPVVVNYCDFSCYWDWRHFKQFVRVIDCDGAIPAYRGFHPHSLGTMNYAYLREEDGWISDIQEKQPFTGNRMNEYASSGTYYFRSGALMRKAFEEQMNRGLVVGGEYYVSLAYKPLLAAGHTAAVYELQHFMQWGTPEDVAEYRMWSNTFRRLENPSSAIPNASGTTLVTLAGAGARFAREGYARPKPLISVSGRPMVAQAVTDLPLAERYVFVMRGDMPDWKDVAEALRTAWPASTVVTLDNITDGQARTALLGLQAIDAMHDKLLTIAACDSGAVYSSRSLQALLDDQGVDVIVWVTRGYVNAMRHPEMYGWVRCEGDRVVGVSVKKPLSDPARDPIITGTFTFRRARDFVRAAEHMIARNAHVNGEFYIDTCINDAVDLGLNCRVVEIDSYLCWGTPNDLKTFEYWQSCFHKWPSHPYRLEKDMHIPAQALSELEQRYRVTTPSQPASCKV